MSEKTKKENPIPEQKAEKEPVPSTRERRNMDRLLEAMTKSLGNVTIACNGANLSRQAHYSYMDKYDSYKKEIEEIKEMAIDFVEGKLFSQIKADDTTSIIFFLKTRGKSRGYSERFEIESKEVDEFTDERVRVIVPDNGRDS